MTKPYLILLSLVAGVAFAGCNQKKTETPSGATNTPAAGGNPITAPVDYLGAVAQAQKRSVKTLDQASLSSAIKMFQSEEERNPENLNELVSQGYLPRLPEPPAGMKFDYNPKTAEVKVVPR